MCRRIFELILVFLSLFLLFGCVDNRAQDLSFETPEGDIELIFSASADMRDYSGANPDHFRGVSERIAAGGENDLIANTKSVVFVIGHEPAYPLPDEENGRLRHENDSLNQYASRRDAFWALLESHGVKAYICGHTHNYSTEKFGSVWQIDVGHARGTGDPGARSTFVMFYLMSDGATWYYTYRLDLDEDRYLLADIGLIE